MMCLILKRRHTDSFLYLNRKQRMNHEMVQKMILLDTLHYLNLQNRLYLSLLAIRCQFEKSLDSQQKHRRLQAICIQQ